MSVQILRPEKLFFFFICLCGIFVLVLECFSCFRVSERKENWLCSGVTSHGSGGGGGDGGGGSGDGDCGTSYTARLCNGGSNTDAYGGDRYCSSKGDDSCSISVVHQFFF